MRQLGLSLVVGMALAACGGGPNPGVDGGPRDGGSNPVDGGPQPDGGNTMVDGGGTTMCGPAGATCDISNPASCGAGMACLINGSTEMGWMAACGPAGVGGDGATCNPDGMTNECQEGFQCNEGLCRQLCCSNEDCTVGGQFCNQIGGLNGGFCQPPAMCDLFAQTGCGMNEECNLLPNGDRICDGAGTLTEGMECMFRNECVPGMGCFGPMGGPSRCRRYCDPAATAGNPGACPDMFTCNPITGITGVGVCNPMTP
ncbi:MAG: hypothetical protein K8H88_29490 [Sandaracinaceae bacterium]|nr:hypothetical protein [Sandaracinaceae bacterium]